MSRKPKVKPLIEFRDSFIHGKGGFALVDIPPETQLVEYVGKRITKEESLRQCELENPYVFTLDDGCDLDGNVDWNPARLLNHSCEPNAEARNIDGRIFVVSLVKIAKGSEITFNYNYDLENYQDHPCQCGSKGCVGYIVSDEFFDVLRKKKSG